MIAEVEMDEQPEIGVRPEGGGIGPVDRAAGGGPYRVVLKEQHVEHTGEPTLQDLREALVVAYGTDYGAHSPTRISRFTDMSRQAASYRRGRVLLAGRRRPRASPAGRPGPQHRRAGCREPRVEAGPGGRADVARGVCSTRTTPNGIRSVRGCCTTRWRRSR